MEKLLSWLPGLTGWALALVFALLLVWHLLRYFASLQGRDLPKCVPNRPAKRLTPLPYLLLWTLAAFCLSRAFLFLGGALARCAKGDLANYLAYPQVYWTRWDADHYVSLIENWYTDAGDARLHIVFFPLYPAVCRGLYLLTGRNAEAIAYACSNLAFLGSGVLLCRLTEITYGRRKGLLALWLYMLSPLTLFCSIPYTESFFLLTTLAAVYLARKGRFFWAVVFGALSANARLCGMATAIPIFYEMVRRSEGSVWKRYGRSVLRVLPVALGLIAYLLLNWEITGDPFRFMTYQSEHWGQNFGSLHNTVSYTLKNALNYPDADYRIGVWIPQIVGIVLTSALLAVTSFRAYPGDAGYALVCFYVSVVPTWLLSGPRYLTALYAVYPLLALLLRRKWLFVPALAVLAALCVAAGWLFAGQGCIL